MPSAHVVTIDCRGYGDSDGFPSEAGFKVDALTAWSWITKRVESHKVLIYGHSLGSGIATNLCLQLEEQQIQPLALVLDAAFTSMPDMMTGYRRIPIVWPFARFPVLLNHFKMRLMDRFETVRAVEVCFVCFAKLSRSKMVTFFFFLDSCLSLDNEITVAVDPWAGRR